MSSRLAERFHHPHQTGKLTPKCRPRDFLSGARWNLARNCLCHVERIQARDNSADFGREFNLSVKDVQSFYNKCLVWLCWQSEANPAPLQFGELQGDLAKLQGQCLHFPAEDPLHLSDLVGFLPNSRSRETKILSREGRIRITVPVFLETNLGSLTDTRSRTRDVCFTSKSGHARRPHQCPLSANSRHG